MSNNIRAQQVRRPLSSNIRGALWALVATALFATVAVMVKVAVNDYHVLQILFFRQIVVFLSSVPLIARSFPGSLKTKHPITHAYRLAGAFVALSCGIWAVAVLPLTTAITLGFVQVFFVALLALYFLEESVGLHRISAVLAGFLGVVVVMYTIAGAAIIIGSSIYLLHRDRISNKIKSN